MAAGRRPLIMCSTDVRRTKRGAPMERILIAVDGSPPSDEAVEFGVQLAAEQDAAVTFVHVVRPLDVIPMACFGMADALPHDVTEEDQQPLHEAKAVADRHGVRSTLSLLIGDVVDEIVACADNLDVDLTVIGSRGHGSMTSALLGSVSRGVLSESKRPVVIVRERVPVGAAAALTMSRV
jgi:nucleotide-binding universal stress UspA family protein